MAPTGTAARLLWLAEIVGGFPRSVDENVEIGNGVVALVEALGTAYVLLRDDGYFGDPDYPEAQKIAAVFGG